VLASLSALAQDSGLSSPEPFAFFDPASSSWRTSQGSLLPDSDSSWPTWPKRGTTRRGLAYEQPTSVPLTAANASSSLLPTPLAGDVMGGRTTKGAARQGENGLRLTVRALLPTPSAYESTPTDEFTGEVRENLTDPHKRLYLPGRKWHAQRTLSRIAPALLPTPSANDHTGAEKETREARRGAGSTGGPSLRDLPKLLPTPTAQAAKHGSTPDTTANGYGFNLWDLPHLLPTPAATDGKGQDLPSRQGPPSLREASRLLPTPQAADGDRTTVYQPRGNPTLRGACTSPPSDDGSNSPGPHHDQLTIEDA
jgi:hypothetical protein